MRTLAVISHKGGSGKTSTAVMIAEELARQGHRVLLIDADRQRAAGLLLRVETGASGSAVQQTRDPRLRYLNSSGIPLRELPGRAEELAGLFDAAVVDTPSLDDPLARGWLQLSHTALMVLPVEPLSVKTLDGAEAALAGLARVNPAIRLAGILPTLFDEGDPTQRSLMLELRSRKAEALLSPAIPLDRGLAHRGGQEPEGETSASPASLEAYRLVTLQIARVLALGGEAAVPSTPPAPALKDRGDSPAQPPGGAKPRRLSPAAIAGLVALAAAALLALAVFRPF